MSTRLLTKGGYIGHTAVLNSDEYFGLEPLYIGGAIIGGNGAATLTVTFSTGLTGGYGGSIQAGDLVIATLGVSRTTAPASTTLATSGYTSAFTVTKDGTSRDAFIQVFYKVMGATPDTTVSHSTGLGSTGSKALHVQVWRNVDTSSPIKVSNSSTGTGTTIAPASITAGNSRSPVIEIGASAHIGSDTTAPTGPTDLFDFKAIKLNNTDDLSMGGGFLVNRSSGATVAPNSWTVAGDGNGGWVSATLELNVYKTGKKNNGIWNLNSTSYTDFFTSFEEPTTGWTAVSSATLTPTAARAYSGLYSVQTNLSVDTDGMYTPLRANFNRDFTAEWWGYGRPCSVYLLNSSGQGYGLRMLSASFEVRRKSALGTAGTAIVTGSGTYAQASSWFRVTFTANTDNTFTGNIYDSSGASLGTVTSPVDTTYPGPFNNVLINSSGNINTSYYDSLRVYKR